MADQKVAMVTGAANGIGRAAAMKFFEAGCSVVLVDNDTKAQTLANEITGKGGRARFVTADISQEEDVKVAVETVESEFGRLDYVLNNAGIEGGRAKIAEHPTDMFDKVINVNLRGTWLCVKYQVPLLLKTGKEGAIVITSSTAGLSAMPEFTPYCASKHGLIGIARSVALEYAGKIRVNCLCPATTDTPMLERFTQQWPEWQAQTNSSYPIGRIATAEEVAAAAVWMCTDAKYMTGSNLVLDGGQLA